ncbi:hypothetical protein DNTS_024956 [Danionella cerebrum]|uniref:Uncharacterized protein n=1 Tax=Danionella cerebrum TaxID=2873325 RepID=A0A553MW32_9TELE|nr:hypothetical protein DNTS_024956 [Danionella translucida]
MNSKRNIGENGTSRVNVNSISVQASAITSHRKQTINSPLKGEKDECMQDTVRDQSLSISALRTRLGPAIRSTLSAAVDTLLGEIVTVMSETQRDLRSKEQENDKLKLRLELSERELKAMQECLCSAQKLIDQLQGPFVTPSVPGHSVYSVTGHISSGRLAHRNAAEPHPDPRCFPLAEPELSGALGDAIHGFDSREEFKSCHLSIQADGTVTNSYYDPVRWWTTEDSHTLDLKIPPHTATSLLKRSRFLPLHRCAFEEEMHLRRVSNRRRVSVTWHMSTWWRKQETPFHTSILPNIPPQHPPDLTMDPLLLYQTQLMKQWEWLDSEMGKEVLWMMRILDLGCGVKKKAMKVNLG